MRRRALLAEALGSLLLFAFPRHWREEVAGFFAALTLGLGLLIWRAGGAELFSVNWVPALGVTYSVELGGVSLALALVTAFMSFIAVLYASRRVENPGTMLSLVLAMETGLLGIFAARDLVLFYVFFEDALLPVHGLPLANSGVAVDRARFRELHPLAVGWEHRAL